MWRESEKEHERKKVGKKVSVEANLTTCTLVRRFHDMVHW